MKVKTGLRAGVTPQDALQGLGDAAGKTAQTVGDAAKSLGSAAGNVVQTAQGLTSSGLANTLSKAFWFPLDPPQ